jgi:hypothetical protein
MTTPALARKDQKLDTAMVDIARLARVCKVKKVGGRSGHGGFDSADAE